MRHPLTYAETLIDYHLCPHPKYKFIKESHRGSCIPLTQKQFLHHTVMPTVGSLSRPALGCREGQGTRIEGHSWSQEEGLQPQPRRHSCPLHAHVSGSMWPILSTLSLSFTRESCGYYSFSSYFNHVEDGHVPGVTSRPDLLFLWLQQVQKHQNGQGGNVTRAQYRRGSRELLLP